MSSPKKTLSVEEKKLLSQIHTENKKNLHLAKSGVPSSKIDRTKINALSAEWRKVCELEEIKQKPKKIEKKEEKKKVEAKQLTPREKLLLERAEKVKIAREQREKRIQERFGKQLKKEDKKPE